MCPDIDYDKAGLQLHMVSVCNAPGADRERPAREARNASGVISVREVLDGKENVQVEAVGTDTSAVGHSSDERSAPGFDVLHSKVVESQSIQPFDPLGRHIVDGE